MYRTIKRINAIELLFVAVLAVGSTNLFAQTFTTLHAFTGGPDGSVPMSGLLLSGNTLCGTALGGGTNNSGTMFSLNIDGSGFTVLHTISSAQVAYGHKYNVAVKPVDPCGDQRIERQR
jgi:uncharacterized repeat protein (TIGR03803 family)